MWLWFKKAAVIAFSTAAIAICVGGWTAVTPVETVTHVVTAATVNPLYQLGCPADAGIPSWECTMWAQALNNDNALRTGINAAASSTALNRVVDAGPMDVGPDSAYSSYVTISPSATATRFIGTPYFKYSTTGAIDGGEIVTCSTKTTYGDSTTAETDGGTFNGYFTMDAGSADVGGINYPGTSGQVIVVNKKDGTYVASVGIRCTTDAGTTGTAITFTMYADEL